MSLLTAYLNSEGIVSTVLGTLAATAYVFSAQFFLFRSRSRRKSEKEELHNTISKGLLSGTLETLDDFVNIYKGIHGLGSDDISYRAGLGKALREYLVSLVSYQSIEPSEAMEIKSKVNKILKQLDNEAPFADLPAAERNLIIDTQRFVDNGDKISAHQKLQDLAGLVEVRQDALARLQATNKWSIPLAIIGLVLTIIFGVVSLI